MGRWVCRCKEVFVAGLELQYVWRGVLLSRGLINHPTTATVPTYLEVPALPARLQKKRPALMMYRKEHLA